MPEVREKMLMEQDWPPSVILEEGADPIQMTELDVSWVFCSVLKMKWEDAQGVKENVERRFLYDKSMSLANAMQEQAQEIEERRAQMEKNIDDKLATLGPDISVEELKDLEVPLTKEELEPINKDLGL